MLCNSCWSTQVYELNDLNNSSTNSTTASMNSTTRPWNQQHVHKLNNIHPRTQQHVHKLNNKQMYQFIHAVFCIIVSWESVSTCYLIPEDPLHTQHQRTHQAVQHCRAQEEKLQGTMKCYFVFVLFLQLCKLVPNFWQRPVRKIK